MADSIGMVEKPQRHQRIIGPLAELSMKRPTAHHNGNFFETPR